MKKLLLSCLLFMSTLGISAQYSHRIEAEKLDRGVVAVKTSNGVFVSWRSLVSDARNLAFDVYRDNVKVTPTPIKSSTNFTDAAGTVSSKYTVKAVLDNSVIETSKETSVWANPYMKIHLDRPTGGTTPAGEAYTYSPNDCSVGDVDGDGEYEIFVKWDPSNSKDNAQVKGATVGGVTFTTSYTGNVYIDCYKLDGTKLWRIDLGRNIRAGAHYTQYMVYDFDGNGKAELICKTAPGTKDSKGKNVIMGNDNPNVDYRGTGNKSEGVITSGPEYLTVFDGLTGEEINTIAYNPPRTIQPITSSGWGDNYGNRCERYLAGVAYLDGVGKNPSAIFVRGYYTYAYVWAVDFDGTKLTEKWLHKSEKSGQGLFGEGAHSLTIGDVDADGCDEIIFGSAMLDHDGVKTYHTGGGHGDALHLAAMDPDREGLQVFMVHEEKKAPYKYDATFRDAKTGEILWFNPQSGNDIGRGLAANISPNWRGYECWPNAYYDADGNRANKTFTCTGAVAIDGKTPSSNFRIYWDGDLYDELLDGTTITKRKADLSNDSQKWNLGSYSNAASCNSTKSTPNLQADLFGDWREEVILHDGSTESDLLVFTTTIPSEYKVNTLMQERQYRVAIAWQNVGYNQPPHLGYNLEESFNTRGALTITSGSTSQIIYAGDAIQPISFKVVRATGIDIENLPEGLSYTFDPTTLTGTITGSVLEVGEYKFTLNTTGADDDYNASLECSLNVRLNTSIEMLAYFPFETVGLTTSNYIKGEATAYNNVVGEALTGKVGNALSLDGSQAYVQEHYDMLNFSDKSFTIELWMNSTDEKNCYLLNKGIIRPENGSGNWVGIEYKDNKGTKELRFAIDDNINKPQVTLKNAEFLFDGQWHQIVVARDINAKTLFMYVDGKIAGTEADNTTAIITDEPLTIGNVNFTYDSGYSGLIDELTIYRGVMSASKVKEHYESAGGDYVAYFPFDDMSESTPNMAYGEATANAGAAYSITGLKGGAINFDDNYYLTQPIYDAINFGEKDFSIELWARSTDDDGYLFCFGTHNHDNIEGGTGNWIGLEKVSNRFTFSIDDDKVKTDVNAANLNAFDGEWHHIVCVRDFNNKTNYLYIDGVLSASKSGVNTGGINFSATELLFIGGDDEPTAGKENRTFNGDIDEMYVYNKALTAEEVEEHYNLLRLSDIEDIMAESTTARYTVVDAFSGRVLRTAVGQDRTDIIDSLTQGIYILVVEDGDSMRTYKFIKR